MMDGSRTHLGNDQNMAGIIRVYQRADALEIDEITFAEIERTRVYFDDVLAVTHHRAHSLVFLILFGIMGIIPALLGIVAFANKETAGMVALLVSAAPFLLTFILHLILKTDYVTVYGKRTMARMRFRIRKGRAREVFRQLSARIQTVQAAAAQKAAAARPPAPLPEPPPLAPGTPPAEPGPA